MPGSDEYEATRILRTGDFATIVALTAKAMKTDEKNV